MATSFPGFEVVPKDEDSFVFERQFASFDFRSDSIQCESAYSTMNWQQEFAIQESFLHASSLMESSLPSDPLDASLVIEQFPNAIQEDGHGVPVRNEIDNTKDLSSSSRETIREEKKVIKRCREEKENNSSISKGLTRQLISKYFYMPITQAAKELNVGLTLLKKRCRQLGIRRWPHRKLMSIQTLIKNVQEMRMEGKESEGKVKEAIEILEKERKMLEELPDMQLEHKTKRLRQACFKANYKKRKLIGIVDKQSSAFPGCSLLSLDPRGAVESVHEEEEDDDDDYNDEIKSLLIDPRSYNTVMF